MQESVLSSKNGDKKEIEIRVLAAARKAGAPIPTGEIPGEEPDFRFHTEIGPLGLEVSELLRPASSNSGIVPAAEEAYHREIVQLAQAQYYCSADANPARVVLYFANARGKRRDKLDVVRSLAEFVRANVHRADPVICLSRIQLPEGFGSMSIASESGDWWCGESGGVAVSDIREQLAARISSKNDLVQRYRANLPNGAQLCLLLYSTAAVSRSMPIPLGIDEWSFPFDFDRVLWFASLENEVVEIQRAVVPNESVSV